MINCTSIWRTTAAPLVISLWLGSDVGATGVVSPTDAFPPPVGQYVSLNTAPHTDGLSLQAEYEMRLVAGLSLSPLSLASLPPGNYQVDSFFDVFVEIDLPGLVGPQATFPDSIGLFVDILNSSGATGSGESWDTEILSMSLTGDVGGQQVVIREDPNRASTGQTTVTDLGNVQFQIDSFFDVYTEISIDGGPWVPSDNALHLELVPAPSAFGAAGVLAGGWGYCAEDARREC
jgi:hypothetical protein